MVASLKRARGITPLQAKLLMGAAAGQITVIGCWAQARRKFHDLHQASQSQMAEQSVKPIAHIDAVERQVKGLGSQERLRMGSRLAPTKAKPVLFPCGSWPASEWCRSTV